MHRCSSNSRCGDADDSASLKHLNRIVVKFVVPPDSLSAHTSSDVLSTGPVTNDVAVVPEVLMCTESRVDRPIKLARYIVHIFKNIARGFPPAETFHVSV